MDGDKFAIAVVRVRGRGSVSVSVRVGVRIRVRVSVRVRVRVKVWGLEVCAYLDGDKFAIAVVNGLRGSVELERVGLEARLGEVALERTQTVAACVREGRGVSVRV